MLTIRVVDSSGSGYVEEATSVHVLSGTGTHELNQLVCYFRPNENISKEILYPCIVYVMNDQGNTIAKHEVFKLPQPPD